MQLKEFDFTLPEELIAQEPAEQRDGSRLMCLQRATRTIESRRFCDIMDYFQPGDLLILNDTRVIPARLLGRKESGGKVEIFLDRRDPRAENHEDWLCLTKSSGPLRTGTLVELADGLRAEILEPADANQRRVRFYCAGDFMQRVESVGQLPLPPYIKRAADQRDRERYQTVFAREQGALAAPTAGLHFTVALLERLRAQGVQIETLTLHVGLGTFLPVRVEDVREHRMHAEYYVIPEATAAAVNQARQAGRRVFALGTTSVRALETAAQKDGQLCPGNGQSEIFIYPGYQFKLVDALITNFHLPRSTLLMLVAAFAGQKFVLSAYRQAVSERFRFFSYGDCMLIV